MQRSRILLILRQLSTKERTRFREYVFSPFFNKNKRVRSLCVYLLQFAPSFHHARLDREAVHAYLFEGDLYNVARINNVISDLLQLLYGYLSQQQFRARPALQKDLLLESLLQKDLHQEVERVAHSFRKIQQNGPHRHHEFFLQQHHYFDKLDRFFFTKGVRTFDENLQLKNDHLDRYYFVNKFRMACDMVSRNIVTKSQYECHFLPLLTEQLKASPQMVEHTPALQIYAKTLQMLCENDSESHYHQLKRLIQQHAYIFPQEDLRILYTYLLNYGIKMINSGHSSYYREMLDVYQLLLTGEVIFKNGHLPHWTFKNICTVGIRLKDFDWTDRFIQQYAPKILSEDRLNAVTYNRAALYYAQKDYKAALQQLHDVAFTDDNYHLGAKVIQLKSYYELNETEALYALVEAFKKFVRRSRQLSDYLKPATLNFAKMTKKIAQLNAQKSLIKQADWLQKRSELQDQMESLKPISNKDWLEEVLGPRG